MKRALLSKKQRRNAAAEAPNPYAYFIPSAAKATSEDALNTVEKKKELGEGMAVEAEKAEKAKEVLEEEDGFIKIWDDVSAKHEAISIEELKKQMITEVNVPQKMK